MGPERRRVDLKPLGGAEEPERTSDLSMGGSLGGLVFIDVLTLLRSDSARCSSVSILVADMIDGWVSRFRSFWPIPVDTTKRKQNYSTTEQGLVQQYEYSTDPCMKGYPYIMNDKLWTALQVNLYLHNNASIHAVYLFYLLFCCLLLLGCWGSAAVF